MIIDARGLVCPQPLIETKKAIKNLTQETTIEVILDNDIAVCNVEGYLKELGITSSRDGQKVIFTTGTIDTNGASVQCSVTSGGDYAVVINGTSMGRGSDELGAILMKAFFNTLAQSNNLPSHVIFYNQGVLYTQKNSGIFDALCSMEEAGVMIIVCGTCVEYFDIKDKVEVGVISNMYKIVEIIQSSSKVVYP